MNEITKSEKPENESAVVCNRNNVIIENDHGKTPSNATNATVPVMTLLINTNNNKASTENI